MLGSSVVSQVSYEELTFAANLIQSRTFLSFEVYLVTTGIYLALSIAMRVADNVPVGKSGHQACTPSHLRPAAISSWRIAIDNAK